MPAVRDLDLPLDDLKQILLAWSPEVLARVALSRHAASLRDAPMEIARFRAPEGQEHEDRRRYPWFAAARWQDQEVSIGTCVRELTRARALR
jgi:hypothetical protein